MIISKKYCYKIYGLNIASQVELPELIKLETVEDNNIDVQITYGIMPDQVKRMMDNGSTYRFEKREMWFKVNNVGTYYISDGNTIIVEPNELATEREVKIFILGSSLGLILLQRNIVAIHGGTVVLGDKAIICTGDMGAGKSTLTSALRLKGYPFIADDVSATGGEEEILVYPAYPQQKLCGDAVRKLGYDTKDFIRVDEGRDKYAIPSKESFINKPTKLGAIFEIKISDVQAVEINEIKGSEKLHTILKNIYRVQITDVSGMDRELLRKSLRLAKDIKVFRISRPDGKFTVSDQIKMIESVV